MTTDNPVRVKGRVRRLRPVPLTHKRPGIRVVRRLPMSKSVIRPVAPAKPETPPSRLREISERWSPALAHIGADPDILVIEDVARILRCTVDTARRIPREQLRSIPGPGRRQLYLREDVIAYVRLRGRPPHNAELLLTQARAAVLELASDRVRERSQRRRTS
jgi:hypothetical protein